MTADEQERQQDAEQAREPVGLRNLVVEALDVGLVDGVDHFGATRGDVVELHLLALVVTGGVLEGAAEFEVDALLAVDDLDARDGAAVEQLEPLLGGDLLEAADLDQGDGDPEGNGAQDHIDEGAAKDALEVHDLLGLAPASSFSERDCQAIAAVLGGVWVFAGDVMRALRAGDQDAYTCGASTPTPRRLR